MKIIAGPCQHESLEHSLKIATECKRVCDMYGITYFFKASYDKANRTSMHSKRGAGMNATLRAFKEIKASLGVKTLTDVTAFLRCALLSILTNSKALWLMSCKYQPFFADRRI